MKKSKLIQSLFATILFLFSVIVFGQAEAKNGKHVTEIQMEWVQEQDGSSQRAPQRGIFQPRESRLVLQLDDLTEAQLEKVDALHDKHRGQVLELRAKLRDGDISREDFLVLRRANYDQHQEELKSVLTKAQWEQLRKLRAERRRSPDEE